MKQKETLSDFIEEDMYIGHPDNKEKVEKSGELLCIPVLKAKERIQNAQRRIEMIDTWGFSRKGYKKEVIKIFKEEFGEKLIKNVQIK